MKLRPLARRLEAWLVGVLVLANLLWSLAGLFRR